jgi:hypothetical protein
MRTTQKGKICLNKFFFNGILKKEVNMNEKLLDKIVEFKEKCDERKLQDLQHAKKFQFLYILIGISLFVFLTLFLGTKDPELFKEIVEIFIVFACGIGAGYGIKTYKDNK